MNSDGSDVKRLTDDSFDDKEPEWSPDGSKIAFSSMRHLNIGEIYVMNADGTQQTRRTQSSGGLLSGAMSPAWSPDGTKIVYAARSGFLAGPEGLFPRLTPPSPPQISGVTLRVACYANPLRQSRTMNG